jgi:hypothetical protein
MPTVRHMTAAEAIARSVSHDEIVVLQNQGAVQAELIAACDDWTDAGDDCDGRRIYEYWGTTVEGDQWRVHVVDASGH